MKVLVTGGTGLIGKPLVQSLCAQGHEVIVLSRHPRKMPASAGCQWLYWDGKTDTGWGRRLDKIDAVINLAGENIGSFPWSERKKRIFRESRINAGRVLSEVIQRAEFPPRAFIQASAVGYYGPHGEEQIDESAGPGVDFSAKLCVDWEESTQPLEGLGIRRIILRTGVVLANHGGVLPLMALPSRLFAGGQLGGGRQGIAWIHIEDEVRAIRFLLENEAARGIHNLTAPDPVSSADFIKALSAALHRPYWFHAPPSMIRAVLGEMSTLVLDGQFAIPKRLLEGGFTFKFESAGSALRDLYR